MTSPSKYTIQLLEGIHDDAQRHHLATEAARLLGTNAEQLEQLLARGIGARIARAGSEKRAEHVAGLLRSVGVNVEVVAPEEANAQGSGENEHPVSEAVPVAALEANPFEHNPFEGNPFEDASLEHNLQDGRTPDANPFEGKSFEGNPSLAELTRHEVQAENTTGEAGSTWWLPKTAAETQVQFNVEAVDPFETPSDADPFDAVIGAQTNGASEADFSPEASSQNLDDTFSTMMPSDEPATWDRPNNEVAAPWLTLNPSASAVPFAPSSNDPFAPIGNEIGDPFANSNADPFGHSGGANAFARAGAIDPFASAITDQFPYKAASASDPFQAESYTGEPYAADPFGEPSEAYSNATTSTMIRNDPFAAPMGSARDPFAPMNDSFASPGHDPFAAPNGETYAPVISLTSTSELPPQARAARDRAPRRSSIQTKTIVALIVPILLVVAGMVGFLSYQLPTTITTLLKARATAIANVTAEALRPNFDRGDVSQTSIDSLSGLGEGALLKVQNSAFFMIEHEAREIRYVATNEGIVSDEVTKVFKARQKLLDEGGDPGLLNGEIINIAGVNYIGAASPFTSQNMMGHGKAWVFVGLEMTPISDALRNTLIPIFVAIGITLLLALAIGTGLARSLLRPIIAATQQANRISLGDLDRTVPNSGNDEIGDLLIALEQMRISLKSMVTRLRRDRA
jgi:HAMP domain-containing protein